jgi:ABC-type multidrug transport system fused ATPase/permease subunit
MINEGDTTPPPKGQPQTPCLARTLLSRAKLVLMNEARSIANIETDTGIQAVLQAGLHDSIVIDVARLLATIAGFGAKRVCFWELVRHNSDGEHLVGRILTRAYRDRWKDQQPSSDS